MPDNTAVPTHPRASVATPIISSPVRRGSAATEVCGGSRFTSPCPKQTYFNFFQNVNVLFYRKFTPPQKRFCAKIIHCKQKKWQNRTSTYIAEARFYRLCLHDAPPASHYGWLTLRHWLSTLTGSATQAINSSWTRRNSGCRCALWATLWH